MNVVFNNTVLSEICLSLSIAPTVCHKLGSTERLIQQLCWPAKASQVSPSNSVQIQAFSVLLYRWNLRVNWWSSMHGDSTSFNGGPLFSGQIRSTFRHMLRRVLPCRSSPQWLSMNYICVLFLASLQWRFVGTVINLCFSHGANVKLMRRQGRIFQVDFFSHFSKKSPRVCFPTVLMSINYRVYRLSRTLFKESDPLVRSKIVIIIIIITIFAFFPRNCRVLEVLEERKEEEGRREGGRRMDEEKAGHVFLTFRMVTGRATFRADPWWSWAAMCTHHDQISFMTLLQKRTLFSWKTALCPK